MLEKDRDVRTQTASELRAELTRLKRELAASQASGSAGAAAAASNATASAPVAVSPAASPSSSDAQLIAGVIRRHRGLAVGTLATLLLLLGAWLALKPGASRPESGAGAGLSIVDLKVEQLTTSGTAASPAISPDGKYVAYVEQGRGGDRLRVRQVATGSNIEIVAEEPRVRLAGAAHPSLPTGRS